MLHFAAANGRLLLLKKFFEVCGDRKDVVNKANNLSETSLHLAAGHFNKGLMFMINVYIPIV